MRESKLSARLRELSGTYPRGMKGWSLDAGLNETAVRDAILKGNPTYETLKALARVQSMSVTDLIGGNEPQRTEIKVVGIVSAGDGWTNHDVNLGSVDFAANGRDMIALQIRGDSMFPVYRNGDYLICERKFGPDFRSLVNLDCVVKTKAGEGFVKKLLKGSKVGRFNLKSYNVGFDEIRDVEIEWAAPIQWVKRSTA
jgi:hypothetical protein